MSSKKKRIYLWRVQSGKGRIEGFSTRQEALELIRHAKYPEKLKATYYLAIKCPSCGRLDSAGNIKIFNHCSWCEDQNN
jgi:hypothetical protein